MPNPPAGAMILTSRVLDDAAIKPENLTDLPVADLDCSAGEGKTLGRRPEGAME